MTWMPTNLRTRIVVLSILVMSIVLLVISLTVLSLFSAGLRQGTDRMLVEDARLLNKLLFLEDGRIELFGLSGRHAPRDALVQALRFRILDASGHVLLRSNHFVNRELPSPARPFQTSYLSDVHVNGEWLRVLTIPVELQGGRQRTRVVIQTARSIQPLRHQEDRLRRMLVLLLPLGIALVTLGSVMMADVSLRPVNRLASRMLDIGADNLSTRLPVQGQDEVAQLAGAFNRLLERLEHAFQSLRRFTADASHEFRNPLMALRTQGEVALSQIRNGEEYRRSISGMLEDISHLEHLTETLLDFARADSGMIKLACEPVDLSERLRLWAERYRPWAEEKKIAMNIHVDPGVWHRIDPALVERAVGNLIDNATRYTPAGGSIGVFLYDHIDVSEIQIVDSGPGIPAEARARVFERFVRLDTARSQPGSGLGLAIVKWVSTLHGGDAYVVENSPAGSCFVITLPKPITITKRVGQAA